MKLTDYQAGQLLHIHFHGQFKYRTDSGARVGRAQWVKMIDTLIAGGYIDRDVRLTAAGREYLDANHLNIKPLN